MKKRIFGIVLSLCMLLSVFPMTAICVNAQDIIEDVNTTANEIMPSSFNNLEYVCEIAGSEQYETVADALNVASTRDAIKLLCDVKESITVADDKDITLDLNGFILDGEQEYATVNNCGNLTIIDSDENAQTHNVHYFTDAQCEHGIAVGEVCETCGTAKKDGRYETYTNDKPQDMTDCLVVNGGCITGASVAGVSSKENAVITFNGGNIVGNSTGLVNLGTGTMNGGTVIGNSDDGVVNSDYTFTMTGGTITKNRGYEAVMSYGTFIMTGGTVSDNDCESTGGVQSLKGTLILTGGTIKNNTGFVGGIYNFGDVYLGGTIKVIDNKGELGNNAVIVTKVKLGTSENGTDGNGVLKPVDGMQVGVTVLDSRSYIPTYGAFTENGDSTYTEYFFSDKSKYDVVFADDHLELEISKNYIPLTDVKLNENVLFLNVNETHQLTYTAFPEGAFTEELMWICGGEGVVSIDENGNVTALANGIDNYAITTDDYRAYDIGTVIVRDWYDEDIALTLDAPIRVGMTREDIAAKITGYDASIMEPMVNIMNSSYEYIDSIEEGGDYELEVYLVMKDKSQNAFMPAPYFMEQYNTYVYDYAGSLTINGESYANDEVPIGDVQIETGGNFALYQKTDMSKNNFSAIANVLPVTAVGNSDAVANAKYYASLTLSDSIAINFRAEDFGEGYDYTKLIVNVDGTNLAVDKNSECVLSETAANEMDKEITIKVIYDGAVVKTFTYSVEQYCRSVLESETSSEKLKDLCKATLNYGAYADAYFDGITENPVNYGYEWDEESLNTPITAPESALSGNSEIFNVKASLTLASAVNLTFTFDSVIALNYDDIEVFNSLGEKLSDEGYTLTDNGGGSYTLTVENIYASNLLNSYTVKVNGASLTYSALNYCANVQLLTESDTVTASLKALCRAIALYAIYANAFFAAK